VAQAPAADRSASRLLHLDRTTGAMIHTTIASLADILRRGDLVVVNNTRVFPARLLGHRVPSGGAVECLLVRRLGRHLESDSDSDPAVDSDTDSGSDSEYDFDSDSDSDPDSDFDSQSHSRGRPVPADSGNSPTPVGLRADHELWEALVHP